MRKLIFPALAALAAAGCIATDVPSLPERSDPDAKPSTRPAAPAEAAAQPVAASKDAQAQALTSFLNAAFEEDLKRNPQRATRLGRKENYDKLDDYSDASIDEDLVWRRKSVADMKAKFARDSLTPAAQLNYDVWALELARAEDAAKFRRQDYVFGFNRSPHSGLPNFMISNHLVDTPQDMEAYIARLNGIAKALDQSTERARLATNAGVRMPKFQYDRVVAESRKVITGQPFTATGPDSPLWADVKTKVGKLKSDSKIDDAKAQQLMDAAKQALTTSVAPGYERLIAWAMSDGAKAPSGKVGAVTLPDGLDYYAFALRQQTTTTMSADEIHQLGLKEVARIHAEMDQLAKTAGFADRQAFLADRDKHTELVLPMTDAGREEYLRFANAEVARVRTLLPKYFGELPKYGAVVNREPAFSEVPGGAAHASRATPDGKKPGEVFVHLMTPTGFIKPEITDLMCHEGIPGHLLQGDIMVRQQGVPAFRTAYAYAAYNEGWALYAERLCKEMGVYPDAWSDYARLDGELWRAVRLVVDTGLHAKGWTEAEAVAYAKANTSEDDAKIAAEVKRFLTYPGQACAYKIGQLTISRLRDEAEQALGDRFDIKAFHDVVVGSGSLPLPLLEANVRRWVASVKAA